MSIEKGPSNENRVEDIELAQEMASLENSVQGWAKCLAEAIKNPDKADPSKLPSWARDEVFVRLDLRNMIRMGVTPEDVIAYGKESAESIEYLAKYTESLQGLTKTQLLQEYFRHFVEGLTSKAKMKKAYDKTKRTHLAFAPEMVAQPKEYQDAQRAHTATFEKRSLVWDRIKRGQPKE